MLRHIIGVASDVYCVSKIKCRKLLNAVKTVMCI